MEVMVVVGGGGGAVIGRNGKMVKKTLMKVYI